MTHKYVDDTTLSEIDAKSGTSNMQVYCDKLVQQSPVTAGSDEHQQLQDEGDADRLDFQRPTTTSHALWCDG